MAGSGVAEEAVAGNHLTLTEGRLRSVRTRSSLSLPLLLAVVVAGAAVVEAGGEDLTMIQLIPGTPTT